MTLEELLALLEQAENTEALAGMSPEDVQALRDQLAQGYQDVRPGIAELTGDERTEGIEALRRVVEAIQGVDAHLAERAAATELTEDEQAALDALDAAVLGDGNENVGTGEGGSVTEDGDTSGTGAAAGEGEDQEGSGQAGVNPAPPSGGVNVPGEAPASEARSTASQRPSLDALARAAGRRRSEAPEPQADPRMTRLVASSHLGDAVTPGHLVPVDVLGRELAQLHETMQVLTPEALPFGGEANPVTGEIVRAGGRKLILGHIPIAQRPGVVVMQKGDGSEVIDQATREYVAARDERLRKVASGGDCVMAEPDYSIRVIGDTGTCFTDDLPTVVGTRPLAYYPWLQINQAEGATGRGTRPATGIGFVTSEQDKAGYGDPDAEGGSTVPVGGAPYKSCIHIDCPPAPLTCSQEAVYKCVTIGNFQAISHPEYVDAFQRYMDIWFDIERDTRAINAFLAEASAQGHMMTTGEGDLTFGAISSLKDLLNRIVAKERSARHAPNLGYNVVAPDWFGGFLALDAMRHTFGPLDNLRTTRGEALALASTDGISFSTYCTESDADGVNQVLTPNTGGEVPDWPSQARLLIYPDGAVFKKTAGELRFGLRETLMRTNDFGMFQEAFEKVCFRGPVFVLDVELCPNGGTGAPVALTCGTP
jgi:hypothetical protein